MEWGNLLFGHSRGEYKINRDLFTDSFMDCLDACGFDSYGHVKYDRLEQYIATVYDETTEDHFHYFENNTFILMPYYWGESEKIKQMPNFVYKPTGYEIKWYKYPLRDSYANQKLTKKEFDSIMKACMDSLGV